MSGTFLYVIAAINVVILIGIIKVFREMKTGGFDEAELERQLDSRGFMNRFLGRLTRTVDQAGADVSARGAVRAGVRHRDRGGAAGDRRQRRRGGAAVVRDPVPADPVRRRHVADGLDRRIVHELRLRLGVLQAGAQGLLQHHVTGLSVAVALVIGTIELGGLVADHLSLTGGFWDWLQGIDLNVLGYIIVGMFVATWAIAVAVWHYGRIEERWSAHLDQRRQGIAR